MKIQDKKTAIISGATGLVGEQLLNQLLADPTYGKVIAVVRKKMIMTHEKLEQRVTDFGQLPGALQGLQADHGFCCLGTTIKTAGSKEQQYLIDHDYVVDFAKACRATGVTRFSVVSSIGASPSSGNFYLRTKGEMEQDLQKIPFDALFILQPSFLMGNRKEYRAGEKIGIAIMKFLKPMMVFGLAKFRGVPAITVARCMVRVVNSDDHGINIIRSDKIS